MWEDFINSKPNFSIALDGYVKGPPRFSIQGPYANFNHHEGVARIATRSTCAQVYFYIRLGLLDTFQKKGEPNAGANGWKHLQHVEKRNESYPSLGVRQN